MNIRYRLNAYGHLGRIVPMGLLLALLAVTLQLLTIERSHRPLLSPGLQIPNGDPGGRRILKSYAELPLSFEPNLGQTNENVKFISRGPGYTLFLTKNEAVMAMTGSESKKQVSPVVQSVPPLQVKTSPSEMGRPSPSGASDLSSRAIRVKLLSSNPSPTIVGQEVLPGKSNYFTGKDSRAWLTDLPNYAKVEYKEVYPGIGLVYYGNQHALEYDFVVAPGADYTSIKLGIEGADTVTIDSTGSIELENTLGDLRISKPLVYQESPSGREEIQGEFFIRNSNEIGFRVAPFDAGRPLIIDPVVVYSFWTGDGMADDQGARIAIDKDGSAYLTGSTRSVTFPIVNAFQSILGTGGNSTAWDAFVIKVNAAGTAIVYSTFLGSTYDDVGSDIAVDASGSAYVVGATKSQEDSPGTPWNECFPLKNPLAGKFSLAKGGRPNVFITKLSAAGNELVYSTLLGGSLDDGGMNDRRAQVSVAVDVSGNAFVAGMTESQVDFPLVNPFRSRGHAFLSKVNSSGSALLYSTYLGTDNILPAEVFDLAIDQTGNAYVAGAGTDPGGGNVQVLVQKVNPSGSGAAYTKLYATSNIGEARGVAVDSLGNAYIAGTTYASDFPVVNAFQSTFRGIAEAIVVKFDAAGQVVFSTFLGGSNYEGAEDISLDRAGNAYVTGTTTSTDFPIANAVQGTMGGGGYDAFVACLNPTGSQLVFSTFLGGSNWDFGHGIAVDADGAAYALGWSASSDFPTTVSKAYPRGIYVVKLGSAQPRKKVQVWQELRLASSGSFKTNPDSNEVTFDGHKGKITRVNNDTVSVLVPPELVRYRNLTESMPDSTPRDVKVVARVIKGAGDTTKVLETTCTFVPPRLLIHDEVTRATPPLLQGVLQERGWEGLATYMFLGYRTDGMAAVRLTNTSTTFPAPISLLAKVISPPPVTLYDGSAWPSVGNLLNVGNQNAAIQFPIDKDGWYIIVVLGGPLPNPPVYPEVPKSPGPFPAQFQIHLAGNVGLPRKLINGAPEFPRGIRLDTYFNHPAPRIETLGNNGLVAGEWAETGLFKFANPVSVSQFPIAVLIPPALEGFPFGTPPVRAGPPLRMGQLPNRAIDITVPMATTTGTANPVSGTVIDLAQIPIPASVLGPGPPAGVARILGATDGTGVTLPPPSSLIVDMGSGNEIVNGSGADFRVIALSGTYQVAVSNTPFTVTFIPVGSGTGQQDFDLEGTGLTSARYVRLTVSSGSASFDAVEALNLFTDQIHPTAGPLSDVGWATITLRRQKSPSTAIDPLLELIGPDGSFLGKNESSFGDDTDADRSDAALIKIPLTQQGFYRYLGRGYDTQPDAQAFGTYFTRLETAGEYDPVELTVSIKAEDQTAPQKQGAINLPRQRDSYLFQASSGTTMNIVVNGVGNPGLPDPLVELYDPEDFLIAANDNYAGRGKNSVITVTLPTTGRSFPDPSTYRIVVMGSDKTTGATTSVSNSLFHVRQENGGKYEVKVFTGSLTGGGSTAPTVASISPEAVVQGATNVAVSISGTHFADGATVAFSGTGVTVTSVAFVSTSKLSVTCNVASEAAVGLRDVTVTNPGGLAGSAVGVLQVRKTLGSVVLNWSAPAGGQTMTAPGGLTAQFNPSTGESASGKSLAGGSGRAGRKGDYAPRAPHGAGPSRTVVQASVIKEVEPNNSPAQAQVLIGDTLIEVDGRAEVRDVGTVTDVGDDIEDLFKVSTKSPGLTILLSGFTSDCDLFLIDPADTTILDASLNTASSGFEAIEWQDLPVGTFLIGVSIYDPDPIGPDSTAYKLQVAGNFGGTTTLTLQSYNVYRSITANARRTGIKAGSVGVGTTSFSDPVPYTGNFYYQVTAVYNQGESEPSNEVSKVVTEVGRQVTSDLIPAGFALRQNYPNPFNPGTTIRYDLPKTIYVRIEVYSMLGQCIRILVDGQMSAGLHTVEWDSRTGVGTPAPSGVYMYRMVAGDFVQTRKLLLLR